jgi:hypothetical protein
MSSASFIIALGIGAALLAFWVQLRFPKFAPETVSWAIFHLVATTVLAQLTAAVFSSVDLQPRGTMALVFGLALPTLVYAFATGMWIIRIAQGMLGRGTIH